MPPLRDKAIRAKICTAFEERTSGGVEWKRISSERVREEFGLTTQAIDDLIYAHLKQEGKVLQIPEKRPEYQHRKYHYDFLILVGSESIYVETVLTEHKMGPVVTVVNVHPADKPI